LDKKEEKINTVTINQIDWNKNNNQNINQNTNRRDKCDIYECRHGGEYMVKKIWYQRIGKISIKLESVFRIGSINTRRIKLNKIILSPMKINLGKISRLH
jgi:hypothetical protein